jgi:hypothetical protein
MKKLKYITIIIVLAFMSSCEDYLETVPYSVTSPENFYKSAKEAELALTGVYNVLSASNIQGSGNQSTYSRNLLFILNGATDEAVVKKGFNRIGYSAWGDAGFTSENPFIEENWFFFYAGINRANYLIEKMVDIDDFSGNRKLEIEGEAKLLRGYYHMILAMMHGAIPVYTTSIQDPTLERQSLEIVYTQILEDFEFAYNNLPYRATVTSHVNKWTAGALLAKVHTYLASAKNSGLQNFGYEPNSFDWVDANSHYEESLKITTDVIAQSGYELISEYDNLFRETTKQYQYRECLLTAEASTDASANVVNVILNAFIPQGNVRVTGGGNGWYRPTGELYYKYNQNDIRRDHNLTGNLPNTKLSEVVDGVTYYVPKPISNPDQGNYCIGKYRLADPALRTLPKWGSSISLPLLRYADILLLHSEAQYFTGDEAGARTTLSMVRQRSVKAPATVDDLNTAYYKSDFVTELLDERTRELCFESWRRFDLARFNKFDETINGLSNDAGFYNTIVPTLKQNWKPERVWIPIPLTQIDLNPNLEQNPGF